MQFILYRKLNSVSITKTYHFMLFVGNNSRFIVRIIRNKSILRAGKTQRAQCSALVVRTVRYTLL